MNIRLSNGIELPKEVVEGFINAKNKMLCAVYRENEEKWGIRQLRTTKFDLSLIQEIISNERWNDNIGDFMIIDEKGNILFETKGLEVKTTIDKNEYIYVNEDELVVHAHSDGFVCGETKEIVDDMYEHIVKIGFVEQDENFGENGFVANSNSRGIRDLMDKKNDKSDPRD